MKGISDRGTGLKEYKRKRDFSRTSEPPPKVAKKAAKSLLFVIQKHAATRLHYDFRLEMDGVLKSWAVPKGLPLKRGDRRLGVHVEDHPMDYSHFEGTIPEGNYGAGTVMVWDMGTYEVSGTTPQKALEEGKIHLTLEGKKLNGEWTLVRLKPRPGESKDNWLFFKTGKEHSPLTLKKEDSSVLSGRTLAQITSQNTAQWISNRSSSPARSSAAASASFFEPMKCKLVPKPPAGKEWIYELKFDGYRAVTIKNGSDVALFSRSHKVLTSKYPEVVAELKRLDVQNCVLDGEVVALDEKGRSSFQLLQNAQLPGVGRPSICYYIFDLLFINGDDIRGEPLLARKERLKALLPEKNPILRYSASIDANPMKLLEEVRRRGMEGLIAKKAESKYEAGLRSGSWVKIKCINQQEFVIGGYTQPQGSRLFFGSVLAGYYRNQKLFYASKIGTGFSHALLEFLYRKFQKLKIQECPFANLPEKRAGRSGQGITASQMKLCTWIKPELVCEVAFTEWTDDGHLRHPSFLGLREDKSPEEVVQES